MNSPDLKPINEILSSLGFSLDEHQPHIAGERFLMMKNKVVLVGTRLSDGKRIIIKTSNIDSGKNDIRNEKKARDLLKSISFAKEVLLLPEELYWGEKNGYVVWAIEFIEQDRVFVSYPIEEQFFIALKAFEAQESFHATTYEHLTLVEKIFPVLHGAEYFKEFAESKRICEEKDLDQEILGTLTQAETFLRENKKTIDTFSNYLTHTDFVPHNFRIKNNRLYMLDFAPEYRTMHFGNKYEGWARFLNYMIIHNPALNKSFCDYIRKNRGEEEYLNLRLMKIYKISFLLRYYAESLESTNGDLHKLTLERINFWHEVLKLVLEDKEIPDDFVDIYKAKRDNLRSDEEKHRQREFAVA